MKRKIFLQLILPIFSVVKSYTQETTIKGKINDEIGSISNVNILNKDTQTGTFSDDNGHFSMKVSIGQKLEITSIQHYKKVIIVNKSHIQTKTLTVELYLKNHLLEEVTVSNKKMFGTFKRNFKQTTRDIAVVKSRNGLDFSNIKIEANKNYNNASNINRDLNNITDPTQRFEGANLGGSFIPFNSIIKKQKQRRKFEFKRNFPGLLLKELGERFFYKELKIPKERYYNFLEYCNPLGIEEKYQEGKILEVIEILNTEAKEYKKNLGKEKN